MRPFRGLVLVPETTSRIPTTKSTETKTAIEAAMAASGMATITATQLRHAGEDDQREPGGDTHAAGRHAGRLDRGHRRRIEGGGKRTRQAGQDVPAALGRHRALHGPEIHRARTVPRDALRRHRHADGFRCRHERDEEEGREERPEGTGRN